MYTLNGFSASGFDQASAWVESLGPTELVLLAVSFGLIMLSTLAIGVLLLVCLAKIFKKAGKPGWHAIIPFLSSYDEFEIAWGNGILFLLLLIPGVNLVIEILYSIKLAKSFGKGDGFALGLIFLPYIFVPILAFDQSRYIGPNGVPAAAPAPAFTVE